ncbi:unnamed protein product [Sphagnum jensenii]|uniref:Uncharacterized protein n=1 Tax=Sphagnum jensenii TaxID=128206 RepID=A0ABP0XBN4_9BRYO
MTIFPAIAICQFWSAVCNSSRIRSRCTVQSMWLILDELALPRRMIISVYELLMYGMRSRIDWMLSILALMKSCTYMSRPIRQPSVFWSSLNVLNFIDAGNKHRRSIASALLVISDLWSCRWRLCSGLSLTKIWTIHLVSLNMSTILPSSRYHAFNCKSGMMLCILRRKACRVSEDKRNLNPFILRAT